MSEKKLKKELEEYKKELKKKIEKNEISPEEAIEAYLKKQDEIESKIDAIRRNDSKYRVAIFERELKDISEIESGVLKKVRLDILKLTNEQLLRECAKDLVSVRKEVGDVLGGLTRWLAKWGVGSKMEKLSARYYQAMTKLLIVLARQNQVIINLLQQRDRAIVDSQ